MDISPLDSFWENMELRLLMPLLSKYMAVGAISRPISIIRKKLRKVQSLRTSRVSVWSFTDLFSCLGPGWTDLAVCSVTNLLAIGEAAPYIVVSKVLGRNHLLHGNPPGGLEEKTIWNLRIIREGRFERMNCVANVRNIKVPWTCRYDDRLPAQEDSSSFPFCAPDNWFRLNPNPNGRAVRTGAHPGSEDMANRIWTRPSGHQGLEHWDVQIPLRDRRLTGSNYLNITIGWPIHQNSKPPGTIDHGHSPPYARWRC